MSMPQELREGRFQQGVYCPRDGCESEDVVRWGTGSGGVQRYRCKACGRTFNDRTGTPMAGTRYPEKWSQFAECMRQGMSCRQAATTCDVNLKTTFYWRHKILDHLREKKTHRRRLSGVVECDEVFFRRSFKGGAVPQHRTPRQRGKSGLGYGAAPRGVGRDKVAVMTAYSRNGELVNLVVDQVNKNSLLKRFAPHVSPASILCSDGSTAIAAFAREHDVKEHYRFLRNGPKVKDGIYHIGHVDSHHARFRQFMDLFNGVATKYLDNYAAWYVCHDETKDLPPPAAREALLMDASALTKEPEVACPSCGTCFTPENDLLA